MNSSSTRAENLEPTTETSNTANTYLTPGYGVSRIRRRASGYRNASKSLQRKIECGSEEIDVALHGPSFNLMSQDQAMQSCPELGYRHSHSWHPETLTAALAKAVLCLNQQPRRVCCIGWTVAFDKRILNLPLDQVDHYPFLRWTIQQTIPDLKLAKSVDEGHATQKPIEMTATRQPTIQHRYRSCRLR
ncbi:hypothetical protein FPSE_08850 [Fusarium pseudograminearum CS3096]|uniref:Uncharacterized protein n=1 Tax=Fusarium pseudograminearum (strain CS3096) TaxID=1028729 RepID=K3UGP2_FUSPC|nr:hypothetical protein FPSE_08850 [Fusarium pseudograminearum CS3096]EKJ70991.1 hypothetical protein FPSE_08850 [Fusarium pseudograminearum CS3096]